MYKKTSKDTMEGVAKDIAEKFFKLFDNFKEEITNLIVEKLNIIKREINQTHEDLKLKVEEHSKILQEHDNLIKQLEEKISNKNIGLKYKILIGSGILFIILNSILLSYGIKLLIKVLSHLK